MTTLFVVLVLAVFFCRYVTGLR